MPPEDACAGDLRLLILPATRRDGEVTHRLLEQAGLNCEVCAGTVELADRLRGRVGAVLLTDVIFTAPGSELILRALQSQPPWSDIPIVLMSRTEVPSAAGRRILDCLTNVTLLDRPDSARTLISAVQAALRTRNRQYQIRDQIEALRQAEEALRDNDRRKDEFLAMLAHELRNPLSPILTASEVLGRMLAPDAPSQRIVAIVKRQVNQLTRLVDDLLDVARITQDRIQLQRQPVAVATIVSQALESVDPLVRSKGHRLGVSGLEQPMYVNVDRARLIQCLDNILTNAAKYTDEGGNISVQVRNDGRSAIIDVADNGVGITSELLPQIFDLFVQSDRSLDRSQGGLGVGLSIVRRLIEMHDGSVSAFSDGAGQGARFEIRLPLSEPPAQGLTQRPARDARGVSARSTRTG